jgi:hypothetical protein
MRREQGLNLPARIVAGEKKPNRWQIRGRGLGAGWRHVKKEDLNLAKGHKNLVQLRCELESCPYWELKFTKA